MSLSDLSKLWTEPTKIGHILWKIWSPSPIFCKKFVLERFNQVLTLKNDIENQFIRLTMIWFSEKMLHENMVSCQTCTKNLERSILCC